jgi:leader peptidase (prepilin peptidase)/N-methyltransferase
MTALVAVICGVLGLCIGSFLNVVIHRVPRRESVVRPRSQCPRCEAPIAERDNIPVVSWLVLRGRCRNCGEPISVRYPMVEFGAAALFVAAAIRFGTSWALPAFCVFFAALLAISVIDIDHFIVPNRVLYPTLFITFPLLALAALITGDWTALLHAVIGGAGGFIALLVVHLISPAGMGFGDVRLAGLIGMMLGWLGVGYAVLGIFMGFLLASIIGIGLIVTRLRGRKDPVPFGPFLAAGAVLTVLWGHALLGAYGHGRA